MGLACTACQNAKLCILSQVKGGQKEKGNQCAYEVFYLSKERKKNGGGDIGYATLGNKLSNNIGYWDRFGWLKKKMDKKWKKGNICLVGWVRMCQRRRGC